MEARTGNTVGSLSAHKRGPLWAMQEQLGLDLMRVPLFYL